MLKSLRTMLSKNSRISNLLSLKEIKRREKASLRLEDLEKREMLTAAPVITEFMALNTSTIQDEDSNFSDWIELGNTGDTQADLSGMYLTNDLGDLTKWQIPATTTLDVGSHLLIFASGNDPGSTELHTNFTLDELGGDLALVDTNGTTIVSQFAAYPALAANQSYGTVTPNLNDDYIFPGASGTDVDVLIPTDNSLGTTWTGAAVDEPFAVGGWLQGNGAVGWDVASGAPTFDVEVYYSTLAGQLDTLAEADAAIAGNNITTQSPYTAQPTTINFFDPGGGGGIGNYGSDIVFPGPQGDDFVVKATTTIFIDASQAGDWTFGFNGDDGGRIRVGGADVVVDDTVHGPTDMLGTINLAAGAHEIELVFFERGGGAEVELFAAQGNHLTWNAVDFDLIGDPNGVLPLGGIDDLVDFDIETEMSTINSTAYIRYPFDVPDASSVQTMDLEVEYDDGYVLYLNGTQIDAENEPGSLDNNSAAVADSGLATKTIDMAPHLSLLRDGENILAFHGLNSSASDNDFLIKPTLSGRLIGPPTIQAFDLPTPGGLNGLVDPIITEFQARNSSTLLDENGDTPDWIEIHNPGQIDMDLAGWHLTDDPLDLTQWTFPSQLLPAGGYLVVFASDNPDPPISGQQLHTNFKLGSSGDYIALVKPDGLTTTWEYDPGGVDYPQQFQNISYGLSGDIGSGGGEDEVQFDPFASLVAYWDFEDGAGTTLSDVSGNSADGTLTNMDAGTDWVTGRIGNTALDFDGSDDVVNMGVNAADLGIDGDKARTVAGWARSTGISNGGGVFSVGDNTSNSFGFYEEGTVPFGLKPTVWTVDYDPTDPNFEATTLNEGIDWFHFAITYDGTDALLYVDGVEADSVSGVSFNTSATGNFSLGQFTSNFEGQIDDLAVWNTALPADVVSSLADESISPGSRILGVGTDGFTVRQVNASATFNGEVTGEVGGGANPLSDVDALLALPGGDPGIDSEFTANYDSINLHDPEGPPTAGQFTPNEQFPLDQFGADDDDFAVHATATLVVPAGSGGEFILGFTADDGGRLMIDGSPLVTENVAGNGITTQQAAITLPEGEYTLDFVFFERSGNAEVELFYASSESGVADSDFRLIEIAPNQVAPPSNNTILDAPKVYFDVPTPGEPNNFGIENFVGPTTFSAPAGYYDSAFTLSILNDTPGASIYYTLDGTDPTESSTLYVSPLNISSTTVIRAKAFLTDAAPSKTATVSYFFVSDILTQDATSAAAVGIPSTWGSNTVQLGYNPNIINDPTWGPQMEDALKQIPAMSIVMNADDLFNASTGIYANAGNRGIAWERATSLELIDPNGEEDGFQVNAGLRIRGGFSRSNGNPKHSFRVFFRSDYGDSKLNYDLFENETFGNTGADSYDSFDLRTSQNYSWGFGGDSGQNTFLRDILSRDFQHELDQPSTRSKYLNLYINGQYWGLYMIEERPEADYAESYFGGDEEDYDVVKNDPRAIGSTDGNLEAYQRLWDYFVGNENPYSPGENLDLSRSDHYFQAQGMNTDGTRNENYERLLDVDSLIDYMIITYYTSDADGPGSEFTRPQLNNYFAIYNRENPDGFKFFEHDSEHSFDTGGAAGANFNMVTPFVNNTGNFSNFGAHGMHEVLANSNSDYLQRFKDRVQEVFLGENALFRSENVLSMIDTRAAEFDLAIIAESARWGEGGTSKNTWISAVNNMKNFITNSPGGVGGVTGDRVEVVLSQFEDVGWWTEFDAPVFDPPTGFIDENDEITIFVPGEPIVTETTLLSGGSAVQYIIPTDASDDGLVPATNIIEWTASNFDDNAWNPGNLGIGYENSPGDATNYTALINTTVPSGTTSVYVRPTTLIDLDSDNDLQVDDYDQLTLKVRYDDGFIAYLNGVQVAAANNPASPGFDSAATTTHDDNAAVVFQEYTIDVSSLPVGTLMPENNVLAIHALNVLNTPTPSSDFLIDVELVGRVVEQQISNSSAQIFYTTDGSDPRGPSGIANGISYNSTEDFLPGSPNGTYLVPTATDDSNFGSSWTGNGFVEGANGETWTSATGSIGYDTNAINEVSGFAVRVIDTSAGDVADLNIALNLLDSPSTPPGFTIAADTTEIQAYVNHGDGGDLASPAVLPFFGTSDRENFVYRAVADVTIPVGIYTLDVGSDDGFRVTLPGATFVGEYNENGAITDADKFQFVAPRGHAHTGASFTVSGSPLVTTLTVDFYERGGGDSVELSIANSAQGAFNSGIFQVLQDGSFGWEVKTTGSPIDLGPLIHNDIETEASGVNSSVYYRLPFNVSNADPANNAINLSMSMLYEDGYIAYVNGVEVSRSNATAGPPTWNSIASASRSDSQAQQTTFIDLSAGIPELVTGNNVLAIQLLNVDSSDEDILLGIQSFDAVYGGSPITLTENTTLKARAFENGEWSALGESFYIIGSTDLLVTEVNYHPADPTPAELLVNSEWTDNDFEFVEVTNVGVDTVSFSGIEFTQGIEFDFITSTTITSLAPGERALVVRNQAAFEQRYGAGLPVIGEFANNTGLNNNSETITLVNGFGGTINSFTYDDDWYPITDGDGFTLVVRDQNSDPTSSTNWSNKGNWRPSNDLAGTPGLGDIFTVPLPGDLQINEVLSNTSGGQGTRVEILNTTAAPLNISNYFISFDANPDDEILPLVHQLPDTLLDIPAGGFLTLNENDAGGFGSVFSILPEGGVLTLQAGLLSGEMQGFTEEQDFAGSDPEVSFGRHINSTGDVDFVSMQTNTFDASNSQPVVGPIVINEIHYHPSLAQHEFIELLNVSGSTVDLTGWSFTDGIEFVFPSVSLNSGEYLVVAATDAATFTASNPVPIGVTVLGPYTNALSNDGERLELSKPGPTTAFTLVDGIRFNDNTPWPTLPDGTGPSLSKLTSTSYGNEPTNWGVGGVNGSPGDANTILDTTPPSDPTNLNSGILPNGNIGLAWTPSVDAESGIDFYRIYRNGALIGTSNTTFYEDNFALTGVVTYEVSAVNGDLIEGGRSNSTQLSGSTITFQEGISGYSGTDDASIKSGSTGANFGSGNTLEVDGDDGGSTNYFLIRWDISSIAPGTVITGASISFEVTDETDGTYPVYPVLKDWVEAEVTWNEYATGQAWTTPGAGDTAGGTPDRSATQVTDLPFAATGPNTANLNTQGVDLVQDWIDGNATNNGFIAISEGNNQGLDVYSSDFLVASFHPVLTLTLPGSTATPGDANLDGFVDATDLQILLSNYGLSTDASWGTADFNDDGNVGLADLLLYKQNFGSMPSAPPAAAESLVVTVDQTISTSSTAKATSSIESSLRDSAVVELTTNHESDANSERNRDAIQIHKAKTQRSTTAVDQVLSTDDSQTFTRSRSDSELRARRGRKIRQIGEKIEI